MTSKLLPDDVRRAILDLATEDYYGLYEILWRLNTLFPDASLGERFSAAQTAMGLLVSGGLVDLYRTGSDSREYTRVPREIAHAKLEETAAWEPPVSREAERYAFAATSAGESEYRTRLT